MSQEGEINNDINISNNPSEIEESVGTKIFFKKKFARC
jgi:5'(3')-deoxyribonucleotidase